MRAGRIPTTEDTIFNVFFFIHCFRYDPHATQFIAFNQISDFIASLDQPLGISKPNIVALVSFNLPIARGNKIHCLDILHALVKHVLGHVEETDEFKTVSQLLSSYFRFNKSFNILFLVFCCNSMKNHY